MNFKQIHKGLPNCTDISILPGDVVYVPPKGFQFELTNVLQAVGTAVTGFTLAKKTGTSSSNTNKTTTGQ